MSQIYAIGDIHGCLGHLQRLMAKVKPDIDHHKLVFIGDYIDRGPDSRGVVDYIIDLKKNYPPDNIICLMGNHERMFLDYLQGDNQLLFLINGGRSTLESYWGADWESRLRRLPADHWEFYQQLKMFYETEDYIFVHGGLKPGVPLAEQQEEDVLWIREEFLICLDDFGKRVIFGHTPFPKPFVWPNKIGIDTGAVYGNYLTCLKLPEEVFYTSR
ncbi:MAG: metallophosphoesterase family protein [Desulfobacteraceae bacterium]